MGLVLMVDPWAKNVDFSGGAAFELRGGLAPPQPSADSEPALWLSVAPRAMMLYRDRVRGRRVSLEYSPQAFLRVSEGILASSQVPGRPLLFHQATLRYAGDLSRRWSWQGSAAGSIGEQDYSLQSSGLVQGDGSVTQSDVQTTQPALLDQPIVVTGGLAGGVGATVQLHPLHSLSFGPRVAIQRLLSEAPTLENGQPLITFDQTSAELTATHTWQATRVDALSTTLTGGYADFGPINGTQAYGSGMLTWHRRLRPRLDSELAGGVFYTRQLEARSSAAGESLARAVPIIPTGNAILVGRVLERARLRITTDINVGSQAYFDPVQGSVLPLSGGGAGVTFAVPPDVTAGITASFYTPPTRPTAQDRLLADEPAAARTTLSVRAPVTYVIDEHTVVETGTRLTARGPHLGVDQQSPVDGSFERWHFTQVEFWLYVAIRLDYTTSRSP